MKTSDISELIKMGKIIRIVNPGEYKFSVHPNKVLYTSGLDSCVGLALIEDIGKMRKRGLAHVYWGGDKEINEQEGRLRISKADEIRVDKFLKEFIGKFKRKPFDEIRDFGKMYSIMIFNRPFYGKTEYHENPMATYIMDWLLKEHRMNLKMSEGINEWKKEHIRYKEMALHHDRLCVLYRNSLGVILNFKDANDNLADFLL